VQAPQVKQPGAVLEFRIPPSLFSEPSIFRSSVLPSARQPGVVPADSSS